MTFAIATSLNDALAALNEGAVPIAGGTDLVVGARQGKAPLPNFLVAIDRIAELATISVEDDGTIDIGSMVTHASLMADPTIVAHCTAIADAAALVGSPATRHVGSIGGNVMTGSPAMDTGAPLMVLGATAELLSVESKRSISLDELWVAPGQTKARDNELCTKLSIPARPERSGSAYIRLEYRRSMEIAVVGAAASVSLDEDGSIASGSVALTAVAPTILGVAGMDELVNGRMPDREALAAVAAAASEQAVPISDLRASETYRRHCVGVMARRAFEAAARRASGEEISVPLNRALGIGAA